jgi:cell division protein FtsZ
LSIAGGSDLGLFEINDAAQLVTDAAHPDANIIFGAVIDDALGDEVRVTVIAAGFDGGQPPPKGSRDRVLNPYPARDDAAATGGALIDSPRPAPSFDGIGSLSAPAAQPDREPVAEAPAPPVHPHVVPPARPYQDTAAEELDVPDFLK